MPCSVASNLNIEETFFSKRLGGGTQQTHYLITLANLTRKVALWHFICPTKQKFLGGWAVLPAGPTFPFH